MRLEDTRRWHWMLIAPFIGVLIAYVRYSYDDGVGHIEHSFNAPKVWEEEAVKMVPGPGGKPVHPAFYDLRVVKTKVKDQTKYVIVGLWVDLKRLDLRTTKTENGQREYKPMRAIFDADAPYKPGLHRIKDSTKLPPPSRLDQLARIAEALRLKDKDPENSVIDYLKKLSAQQPDVKFQYEWWKQLKVSMAIWAVGCFFVIGVIWPTVINLIAFGSPVRPREKKEARKAKSKPTDAGHKPKVTASDMEELRRLEEEMERKLREGAPERGIGVGPADKPAETPVKPLTGTETVAAIPAAETKDQGRKAFGMDGDDLYPTEVHGHTKKGDE